jgi:hypothetical protein
VDDLEAAAREIAPLFRLFGRLDLHRDGSLPSGRAHPLHPILCLSTGCRHSSDTTSPAPRVNVVRAPHVYVVEG